MRETETEGETVVSVGLLFRRSLETLHISVVN